VAFEGWVALGVGGGGGVLFETEECHSDQSD
jgi:hypothetical protein